MKFGIYTLYIENWMTKKKYPELFKGMFEYGWGTGYVLLPHNHPFYGVHYDDLNISIHGGLTYGNYFSNSKFLGPLVISFNPQYNAIIGGRGTGKSTISTKTRLGISGFVRKGADCLWWTRV